MSAEDINKFIWEKWCKYSSDFAISYTARKNKDLTIMDVKDAFSSGVWEFIQLLRQNDINIEDIRWKE